MIVTIDGPAGTGKSTVARELAQMLGFEYLDTGAMYRMIALEVLRSGIDVRAEQAVARVAGESALDFQDGAALLNGEDVSSQLRTPAVAVAASQVAQNPEVRELLVERQRQLADGRNIVCEGRDQGTIVFPQAEHKFFLTATPEVRAERRLQEMQAQGKAVDFEQLLAEQNARDERDQNRTLAPLQPAADACLVDTTQLDLEAVIALLLNQIQSGRSIPADGDGQAEQGAGACPN